MQAMLRRSLLTLTLTGENFIFFMYVNVKVGRFFGKSWLSQDGADKSSYIPGREKLYVLIYQVDGCGRNPE